MNDPYTGGLSSYALILMIIAYIQYGEYTKIGSINFYDHNINIFDISRIINDFGKFYSTENDLRKIIIQPRLDISQNQFDRPGPILYKYDFEQDLSLHIVDPLDSDNNVGKSSFNIDQIKNCFKEINDYITMSLDDTKITEYQKWIEKSLRFGCEDIF